MAHVIGDIVHTTRWTGEVIRSYSTPMSTNFRSRHHDMVEVSVIDVRIISDTRGEIEPGEIMIGCKAAWWK